MLCYGLNRLRTYTVGNDTYENAYDQQGKGNISTKSDIGDYYYSQTKTHRLDSILNLPETIPELPQQEISYTKFNKISALTQYSPSLTKVLTFTYGPDEQRVKTVYTENSSTVGTKYFALGNYEKEVAANNSVRELYYISAPTGMAAIIEKTGSQTNYYYIHTDIVGSFDVITNSSGTILERLSFDPWGRRRNPADWTYTGVPASFMFDRGFTGHEHLDRFDLINMNGRVYDPLLAMFLSPDNYIQAPDLTQNFGRYSYCLNNPLKYTDPSGDWVITALVTLANMWLSTSATNDWQFNPANWDWSSAKTWVSLVQSGISGYKMGSSAENYIKQKSFDRKMERLSEKAYSEYNPMEKLAVPDESLISTQNINSNYYGSLNHNIIGSELYFQGNDLRWYDTYSDGTLRMSDSWAAESGPWPKGPAPEGLYNVQQPLSSEAFKRAFPGQDLSPYTRDGVLFKVEMIPQFLPKPFRSLLAIHPDGGLFKGTNGCIGLQENAQKLIQFFEKVSLYLSRNGCIKLQIDY